MALKVTILAAVLTSCLIMVLTACVLVYLDSTQLGNDDSKDRSNNDTSNITHVLTTDSPTSTSENMLSAGMSTDSYLMSTDAASSDAITTPEIISLGPECERTSYIIPYYGNQRVTVSNATCLRWEQLMESLAIYRDLTQFPDESFDEASNKCRNPNSDLNGAWCFTMENEEMNVDYCGIRQCADHEDVDDCQPNPCRHGGTCTDHGLRNFTCECAPGFQGIFCEAAYGEGRCLQHDQAYTGNVSHTMHGVPCITWINVLNSIEFEALHEDLNGLGISTTNVTDTDHHCKSMLDVYAVCFAIFNSRIPQLHMCNIHYCNDFEPETECYLPHFMYAGNRTFNARDGRPCIDWPVAFTSIRRALESEHNLLNHVHYFPEVDIQRTEAKCRNPHDSTLGPWCYTLHNYKMEISTSLVETMSCDIPVCQERGRCRVDHVMCWNGGTCESIGVHQMACHCPAGFQGFSCEAEAECHTGSEYAGDLSYDHYGKPCINWQSLNNEVDLFQDSDFPDDTMADAAQKCRVLQLMTEDYGMYPNEPACFVWVNGNPTASHCNVPKCTQNVCDRALISPVKYRVSDAAFSSSSHVDGFQSHMSRMRSSCWSAEQNDLDQWIKVDLEKAAIIHKIVTLGKPNTNEWVMEYKIAYSDGLQEFQFVAEIDSNATVFQGNTDSSTKASNTLLEHIVAQFVVLYPISWNNHISLRWELIGCAPVVRQPVYQSSTANGFDASLAIDGNVNTDFEVGSCSLTGNELRAWWTVDLGSLRRVYQVLLFNRNDSQGESLRRLFVWLLNDTHNPLIATERSFCTYRRLSVPSRTAGYAISCERPTVGRYLSIQQHAKYFASGNTILSTDPLSLCEVLIIDEETPLECKRPSDGFYNGAAVRGFSLCMEWQYVYLSMEDTLPSILRILGDINSFFGDESWEELGRHCRNPSRYSEGPYCLILDETQQVTVQGCEMDECPDNCTPNPCFNDATCRLDGDHVMCLCIEGYFGRYCESDECIEEGDIYSGDLNINTSGFPCLNWELTQQMTAGVSFSLSLFPDASWQALGNKCRLFEEMWPTPGCFTVLNNEVMWAPCTIPLCNQIDLEDCVDTRGQYRGSMTISDECVDWRILYEEYSGHPIFESIFNLDNFQGETWEMVSNKCRNPINTFAGPFCMTNELSAIVCAPSLRGCTDQCDPGPCMNGATCFVDWHTLTSYCACANGFSGRYCESGDCRRSGDTYTGNVTFDAYGRRCWQWEHFEQFFDYSLANFPDSDWSTASNKCRDPAGSGTPQCIILTLSESNLYMDLSDCHIPICIDETPSVGNDDLCRRESRFYTGSHTEPGCLSWQEVYEISEIPFYRFPEESWEQAGSYCRNPDYYSLGPWCYTAAGDALQKHHCTIPVCEEGDDCTPNPCLNGGECIDYHNSWTCQCSEGYHGLICEANECIRAGEDYLGNLSVTISGKLCLPWTLLLELFMSTNSQVNGVFDLDVTDSELGNKCRIVDTSRIGLTPSCTVYDNSVLKVEECNIPFCEGFEPEHCAHLVNESYWYKGDIRTTQTERQCVDWQAIRDNPDFSPYGNLDLFPDESWDSLANKCRNPDGQPLMWCFTDSSDPDSSELCAVPRCGTVLESNACDFNPCLNEATCVDGEHSFQCQCQEGFYGLLCESSGCRQGITYSSNVSVSRFGLPCLTWESLQYLEGFSLDLSDFESGSSWEVLGNKCRNPDSDENGPWCVVFFNVELFKDYCNIVPCE